jgi:DNA-binding beta-propeller fold protein YncE
MTAPNRVALTQELLGDWSHRAPVEFDDAAGVAVDAEDRVFVLTRRPSVVLVFSASGNFEKMWGEGLFTDRAHGISVGPDGNVYCVDDSDHTVRKFTPNGRLLLTLGISGQPSNTGYDGKNLPTITHGGPPFNRPTNLAVGPEGELFVSDGYGNARVHKFSPSGEPLRSWGGPGIGEGEFHLPHGICALPDGRVMVADRENERIQVFDSNGVFLTQWIDIQRPTHIAHDVRRDRIIVSELSWRPGMRSYAHGTEQDLPSRVSVLTTDGEVVGRWGGVESVEPGNLIAAHGVAVDSAGDVYVSEVTWTIGVQHGLVPPGSHTLQKFALRVADSPSFPLTGA